MTAAGDAIDAARALPVDAASIPTASTAGPSAPEIDTPAGAAIAAALAELDQLNGRPVEQHVDVYERAHGRLQAAMADADEA